MTQPPSGSSSGQSGASRALGVCSWSMRPQSATELVSKMKACGLSHVQLALEPIRAGKPGWEAEQTFGLLEDAGITVVSGMMQTRGEDYSTLETIKLTGGVRPDAHWQHNLGAASEIADLASDYGLSLVTFHAGFIPEKQSDPLRRTMMDRLLAIIEVFSQKDVSVGFETGQEHADTLCRLLDDLEDPLIGVNFDPANMILYGMGDPIAALRDLAPFIVQMHIKDALPTKTPGTWGTEVCVGTGAVNWDQFFKTVAKEDITGDYIIEREAGQDRTPDIIAARDLVRKLTPDARV